MAISNHIETRYGLIAQEDRCAPRVPVNIAAMLRASGSNAFEVVVTDISIAGFACQVKTGVPPGTLCWLTLPGLKGQPAQIVWNNGTGVGCAFASLLDQAVLDAIVAPSNSDAG